jgi:hypothetical protein
MSEPAELKRRHAVAALQEAGEKQQQRMEVQHELKDDERVTWAARQITIF